jgi:hypothetical protein
MRRRHVFADREVVVEPNRFAINGFAVRTSIPFGNPFLRGSERIEKSGIAGLLPRDRTPLISGGHNFRSSNHGAARNEQPVPVSFGDSISGI